MFPTLPAPATGQLGEQDILKLSGNGFVRPPGPVSALKYCGMGGGSSAYDSETSANTVQDLCPAGNTADSVSDLLEQLRWIVLAQLP